MTDRLTFDESRVTRAGVVTVTVTAQPLEVELDEQVLAQKPAEAVAQAIGDGIKGITEMARSGKHRLFNRTGELANGIEALPWDGEGYPIAAPDGYLQDPALLERLVALVPVITDPTADPKVVAAIEQSADDMLMAGPGRIR
jgi:hypothetical protein